MPTLEVKTKTIFKCPECGFSNEEEMPVDRCQFFYECTTCGAVLRPKEGDCCVFCSFADTPCPSKQLPI